MMHSKGGGLFLIKPLFYAGVRLLISVSELD